MDRKGHPKTGMTGGFYCDMILKPFREFLQKEMMKKYPNVDERNERYQRMYFEQGSTEYIAIPIESREIECQIKIHINS